MRAGEVVAGMDVVRARRGDKAPEAGLARGPGNLGQALGLDLDVNGSIVEQADSMTGLGGDPDTRTFTLIPPQETSDYVQGPRIGISKSQHAPLRFWIPGHPTVSTPRSRPRPTS